VRPKVSRTTIAATLIGAAILVPCAAWFGAGSRSVAERGDRLRGAPLEEARADAQRAADRVVVLLENLRQRESLRPFSDYGGEHARLPGCELELSPEPEEPNDPLIWTRFEIDDVGRLTLPQMRTASVQLAAYDALECAGTGLLAALGPGGAGPQARLARSRDGVVTIGPFSWHTLMLQEVPTLVALREVATPKAVLTQGFVTDAAAIGTALAPARHPTRFLPGEPTRITDALVRLDGDPWHVAVDPAAAVERADAEATRMRRRFRVSFAMGTAVALLAGGAMVLLVSRTERLARERARFAASAAHELRTPLAGLQLYGEMLASGGGDPARRADYARRIGLEAERLGRVVTNVLGVTRMEQGDLGVRPRVDDLVGPLRRTLQQLTPALEARGVRVEAELAEPPLPALFDTDALHQIVQNLLDNAEKYSRSARDRTISVRLAPAGGGVRLAVLDRGRGVAPARRGTLFQPYERGGDGAIPEGLGLGLALVRALARAQGAVVAHAARQGGGSVFSVTFRTTEVRAAS